MPNSKKFPHISEVFFNRFGDEIQKSKFTGEFKAGDIVYSSKIGLCMIQDFFEDPGKERYWIENGEWGQATWDSDLKKASKKEAKVFLETYREKFIKTMLDRFFPVGDEFRPKIQKHLHCIDNLITL